VPPPKEPEPEVTAGGGVGASTGPAAAPHALAGPAADAIVDELARLRAEIADLREALSVERT